MWRCRFPNAMSREVRTVERNDDDDYDESEGFEVEYELISSFRREIDTSTACIAELRRALLRADLPQIIIAGLGLYQAWDRARKVVLTLEAVSHPAKTFARDALRHSHNFARKPLARAVVLLAHANHPPPEEAHEYD